MYSARQILPENEQAYVATFAGFFPADAPQYSVVCAVFTNPTAKPSTTLSITLQKETYKDLQRLQLSPFIRMNRYINCAMYTGRNHRSSSFRKSFVYKRYLVPICRENFLQKLSMDACAL